MACGLAAARFSVRLWNPAKGATIRSLATTGYRRQGICSLGNTSGRPVGERPVRSFAVNSRAVSRMGDNSNASARLRAVRGHLDGPKRTYSTSATPAMDFSRLAGLIPGETTTTDTSIWYVVATAALMSFHQEAAVGELYKFIAAQGSCDKAQLVTVARRIRETCLKASVLVGFPRVSSIHLS